MHRGYIKLFRKVSDNELWTDEKFTRGQAWIDLIMLANHKDSYIRVRGIKVPVLRGQCGWSEVALADRWGWSRGKVRRFLSELETIQQIEQQKNNVTSIINITNYREYQGNGTPDSTTNGTANGQQTDTNKNVKNVKKKKRAPTKREKFVPPDIKTVQDYFVENGYTVEAGNKFFNFYSNGNPSWHDSRGNPVIGWKQKAQGVWFKPENKNTSNALPEISENPYG